MVDAVEWACVLCGPRIQNDWGSSTMNLHQILHSAWTFLWETFWMIQNVMAMGNWWLAASSQQWACSHITSQAEYFGKTSNHPGDSAPLQPRFGALRLLAFPKTKITFEREEISDHRWDSGKYNGVADGDWENCVKSQHAYFEGDWGVIVLCTIFLVFGIFFNITFFILHGWIPLDRLHVWHSELRMR